MRKGERGANLLLSAVREVVPFYRPDTDGEIFATEKSSVTQISTRSCRSIRFADSARRQRVDHTRSLSVGFLSALRGKGGPETDAREKNTARPTAVTSTDLSLSFSLSPDFSYFEHFPTRRGYDPRVGIHMVHGMCAIGRDGVPMIKIEKSASLNVIVNRNTGFHLRVSTNGWNRYFGLWRAWLMTACCKIVSYVGDF